jgi:hypothetical protein
MIRDEGFGAKAERVLHPSRDLQVTVEHGGRIGHELRPFHRRPCRRSANVIFIGALLCTFASRRSTKS